MRWLIVTSLAISSAGLAGPPCIPRDEPSWTCPEVAVVADGDHAIACFRETCGGNAIGCMRIDPRTGSADGSASWPVAPTPGVTPPSPFELFAEGRTVAVCRDNACRRVPDMLPVGTSEVTNVIIDATGTQLFLLDIDEGDTWDIATRKHLAHVDFAWGSGPPPPTGDSDFEYFGRDILIGDFDDPGTYERAIDPITGRHLLLDKPWARLPGDLLVHYDGGRGVAELIDFDAHLRIVARRKAGKPHRPREAVIAQIVTVGTNALVVTQDPPATLLVDSKTRTISQPRGLPTCR